MSQVEWETVIGLEVHVELATETKLFSPAPNRFGDEPNTNVSPVCLGLPGVLPVLNRKAVELAIKLGLAVGCRIQPSVFARKNYFYPDMTKNFQTSQFDRPICVDGLLELPDGSEVRIERAHLEEDAGKSTHIGGSTGRVTGADYSKIDYNRAGVPLLEIVSHPDIRSAEQAKVYAEELRAILVATATSDARLEEGSMRVDANVSVRPVGADELRTRCEIKNVNSFRSLGRAIEYEARRHVDLYEAGEEPVQETRHWNEDDGRTHTLRTKEDSHDYRYFDEPDLVPLAPETEWVETIRASLPVLPAQRRRLVAESAGTSPEHSALIVGRDLDELFIAAVEAGADAGRAATHAVNNLSEGAGRLSAKAFAALVVMETGGDLTATQAKVVLGDLVSAGGDPVAIAASHGFEAMAGDELEKLVDEAIAADSEAWEKFLAGEDRVQGAFVGYVMKATKGQADGKAVSALLRKKRG
ncbi:MAG: Asp-tRNA(Asn)/Glu-tRNA(Gln) amidotransferase subunit GatB [Actinomycetia bacterium]|nr:Asp-tRNA(Asn)/Glu-tRNA(Gln) amidotransferase subunit GatB [Actinomycetes bacterium]MCP4959430.1 Asp-tRNA(Asn)/Glu-tRNA(Gln) amidotransferase subunit GatB [Actinomycetes bacterium]